MADIGGRRVSRLFAKNTSVKRGIAKFLQAPWWALVIIAPVCYFGTRYVWPLFRDHDVSMTFMTRQFMLLAIISTLAMICVGGINILALILRNRTIEKRLSSIKRVKLAAKEFECLVDFHYRRYGYQLFAVNQLSPTHFVAKVVRGRDALWVHCVTNTKNLMTKRELMHVVKYSVEMNQQRYAVMTTGAFHPSAIRYAEGKGVELIDGRMLQTVIKELQHGWVEPEVERQQKPVQQNKKTAYRNKKKLHQQTPDTVV